MSSKKILLLFFLLILLPNIFAVDDFSITATTEARLVCPTSTILFTTIVENTGTSADTFTVSMGGNAASWSTTVPLGFVLIPGESKLVYSYVTPKSSAEPGKYNLEIIVSNGKISKSVSYVVEVKDCYKISVNALEDKKSVCPGDKEKFTFVIKNEGEFKQQYVLSVEGSGRNFVTLSQNLLELDSKESKSIDAFVDTPIDKVGEFDITLTTRSMKRIASSTVKLNIEPCFNYVLESEKDFYSLCDYSTILIPITIKNEGSLANIYNLELKGPAWTTLEKTSLSVASGNSDKVNIMASPDYGVEGDFSLNFEAVSENGKISKERIVSLNVRKCNSVNVEISKDKDRICNSLSNEYNVLVKNDGEVSYNYQLLLEGPEWASLSKDIISLEPGIESLVSLVINPGSEVESKEYDIKVIAEAANGKVKDSDIIKVETVSIERCYEPNVKVEKKTLDVGRDSTATLSVVVENKGSNKAVYNIEISGTAVNFVQVNPGTVTLDPGKAEVIYLYVAPSSQEQEGSYSLAIAARLQDTTIVDSEDIKIKVSEEAEVELPLPEEEVNVTNVTKIDLGKYLGPVKDYKWYIIGAIIVLFLIIFLTRVGFFKAISEFFKEEEEVKEEKVVKKEEKPKRERKIEVKESKILPYFSWLVILLVVMFVIWKYVGFSYVLAYKWYVILGIVILAILIALLKSGGKDLIEFFEEEEEKVKEKPKREEKKVERKVGVREKRDLSFLKYIIILLVVVAILYVVRTYLNYGYLLVYKWYVVVGLVILGLGIFLNKIGFFKLIKDFFAEEEEEKVKKRGPRRK